MRPWGVFKWASNQVINEMVLDGGGHFSPTGIDGVHTLSLLLSSHTAHDRVEGNPIEQYTKRHSNNIRTWVQYKPIQGGMNSVPLRVTHRH